MNDGPFYVGVDVATADVRVIVCAPNGEVLARGAAVLPPVRRPRPGWAEQDASAWRSSVTVALRQATAALGSSASAIEAISITATSGTVVACDLSGMPLVPALMYDDRRAAEEAARAQEAGGERWARLGLRVVPSFGLSKAGLFARQIKGRPWMLCHTADLVGWGLTGHSIATDWSHALKSGYDPVRREWPLEAMAALGIDVAVLPPVEPPTSIAGRVSDNAAAETGVPAGTKLVLGMTDGCAAQLATGANEPGAFVTVLGTTMVIKGVSTSLVKDPTGGVYSHRHPEGAWLPGGASNTGGEALSVWSARGLAHLDESAAAHGPATVVAWPLRRSGERFPMACPDAEGFVEGEPQSEVDAYRADLEGVAYLERLGYDRFSQLGARRDRPVITAGGGARSDVWCRIRAGVLNQPVGVAVHADSAFGAAMLAASASVDGSLASVSAAMVRPPRYVEPDGAEHAALQDGYIRFTDALQKRGWLPV